MALPGDKERVTIVMDKKLLAELDAYGKKMRVSRSALFAGLIEIGFKQTRTTQTMFANKFVAKALRLIFGDAIVRQADLHEPADTLPNPAADAIRRSIIEQIRELSVVQAEAEISRDLGLSMGDGMTVAKGKAKK